MSSGSFAIALLSALFLFRRSSFQEGEHILMTVATQNVREAVEQGRQRVLTKNKALAKKVYEKIDHPIHPPVPFPPFDISLTSIVAITPTNL